MLTKKNILRYLSDTIVFCFDNCAAKSSDKFVLVWLKCCPSYRSRKKGIKGKFFEAEAVGRGWEMFPRFPFFYWSTLDNTEIRLGPNLYERRGKHNYWNRILFSFVWLFRGVTTVIRIKNGGKNSENSTSLMDKFFVPWTIFLFLGQFFCSLDNFFVLWTIFLFLWTIFLFFGQFFCSFGQFFCSGTKELSL